MQDGSVGILDLSIGLRVPHGSKVLSDAELEAPLLEGAVCELSAIIRDEDLWYTKSANYALPKELLDRSAIDRIERFDLDPISEVVNCHHYVLKTA